MVKVLLVVIILLQFISMALSWWAGHYAGAFTLDFSTILCGMFALHKVREIE